MQTLVLDSNELVKDWKLVGLNMTLLSYSAWKNVLQVEIPLLVLDEVTAAHGRAVETSKVTLARLNRERSRLGLSLAETPEDEIDYRQYLEDRVEEQLGFNLTGWPRVDHAELVQRAVNRLAPFDSSGGGYRDSLIWMSALALAESGRDVILVSSDLAFSGKNGELEENLASEAAELTGSVILVRDLSNWLLSNLPWKTDNLKDALALARDESFEEYLSTSDFHVHFAPDAESIGFQRSPYSFQTTSLEWNGCLDRVSSRRRDDGAVLVEYDIGQEVQFEALVSDTSPVEGHWDKWTMGGLSNVNGESTMVLRIAVLFAVDQSMEFDEISWRRADGTPRGAGIEGQPLGQPLFEL